MDYKLPDGSGLDVAERVRSKWDATPIILISGYDPSAVALRAEKLRISDFLEKPDWLFQGSIGIITGEPAVFSDDVRAHPDSILAALSKASMTTRDRRRGPRHRVAFRD